MKTLPDARPEAVYIHIGHGKTGSSFLQSALALSTPTLAQHGLIYPIQDSTAAEAHKGHITGGNVRAQTLDFDQLLDVAGPGQRLLMSSESFFFYLPRNAETFQAEYARVFGDTPLHVLLYLRDPVDHAVSTYQQSIKRGGYTHTLAKKLEGYTMPQHTITVISALQAMGATLTIHNYSRCRDTLVQTLEQWLDLPGDSLTRPEYAQVNRSLTLAELEVQRLVNKNLAKRIGGSTGRFASDPLCNELPDIKSETPPLAPADLQRFLDRMQEELSDPTYTALVPEAARPHVGTLEEHASRFPTPPENPQDTVYTFTQAQLDVLIHAMTRPLLRNAEQRQKRKKAARDAE